MAKPAALAGLSDSLSRPQLVASPQTPAQVQAAIEGVTSTGQAVTFLGVDYRIADRVGLMPLMRFAWVARQGVNGDDMEGLAAIYDMLHDCLHTDDWDRFQNDATTKKAEADDLLQVVAQTIELLTARPTQRPSDSSGGPLSTSPSSTGSSSSQAIPDGLMSVEDLLRRAEAG